MVHSLYSGSESILFELGGVSSAMTDAFPLLGSMRNVRDVKSMGSCPPIYGLMAGQGAGLLISSSRAYFKSFKVSYTLCSDQM